MHAHTHAVRRPSLDSGGRSVRRSQYQGITLGPSGLSLRGAALGHRLPTPSWSTIGPRASHAHRDSASVQVNPTTFCYQP